MTVDAVHVCEWFRKHVEFNQTLDALDFGTRKCFEYMPKLYAVEGRIGFGSLLAAVHDEMELRDFFAVADANHDGRLTREELQTCIRRALRTDSEDMGSSSLLVSGADMSGVLLDRFFWTSSLLPTDEKEGVHKIPRPLMRFAGISGLSRLLRHVRIAARGGSSADELMEWLARWRHGQVDSSPALSRLWDRVHMLLEDASSVAQSVPTQGWDPSNWAPLVNKGDLLRVLKEDKCISRHLSKPNIQHLLAIDDGGTSVGNQRRLPVCLEQLDRSGWFPQPGHDTG
eukprot:TRINITY_DN2345_c0_g1_i1.p1 TRINITY_DN2345_c0_g1~~TRINITY_DN2345_c0_g1_i1.p1  ORF type:complete len:285 (+),score=71.70 TRINITY_DN2345_c0_g1_i1:156-1010(+)